jgi:hypothetical protein
LEFVLSSFFATSVDSKGVIEFVPAILTSFLNSLLGSRSLGIGWPNGKLCGLALFGLFRVFTAWFSASFGVRLEFVLSSFFATSIDSKGVIEFVPTILTSFMNSLPDLRIVGRG